MTCVFCRVVGDTNARITIDENDGAVALLDIRPVRPGHVLVVARAHAVRVPELPPAARDALFALSNEVARRVVDAGFGSACNILINDGPAAGQHVPHVHVHIIPRVRRDAALARLVLRPLSFVLPPTPPAVLQDVAVRLRARAP